ncbi:YxlC family protein [Terribacillus saccharophilus]|uniref:YxlC family protein n=1 Tax=Terribacillus saccharophilus TaxID=361277 RepID=UPI002DD29BB0|nr:YxlC family protein [Terribacillus saccharophilus]
MKKDDWIKKMDETWGNMDTNLHIDVPETDEMLQQISSGEKRYRERMRRELCGFIILACVLVSFCILMAVHITWAFYVLQIISIIAVVVLLLVERSKGRVT